jgi:hypothetical protein
MLLRISFMYAMLNQRYRVLRLHNQQYDIPAAILIRYEITTHVRAQSEKYASIHLST